MSRSEAVIRALKSSACRAASDGLFGLLEMNGQNNFLGDPECDKHVTFIA